MDLAAGTFADPTERREFPYGHVDVVTLGTVCVARMTFRPGWRWSTHVQPTAGTPSCEVTHVGYLLAGRMAIRTDGGGEAEAGPGDVVVVPAGHDGWVVGDEDCVMLDWAGGTVYAR